MLEAVIWDMDGIIVNSGPYHLQAWQEVFGKRGVNFTEEDFRRNFGQRNDSIIWNAIGRSITQSEMDTIANEKEESYRRRVAQNIEAFPGAVALMKALTAQGVKMAIASSAPPENIDLITRGLGIKGCFKAIVWGREVTEGKPSPQGFLLAAQRLEVKPRNCVVIEDSIAGVSAAKGAGMKCVAVTNTNPPAKLAEADCIVDTLEAVSVDDLAGLFQNREKV